MITLHLVMSLDLSCVPDQGLENSRIIEIKKYFSSLVLCYHAYHCETRACLKVMVRKLLPSSEILSGFVGLC